MKNKPLLFSILMLFMLSALLITYHQYKTNLDLIEVYNLKAQEKILLKAMNEVRCFDDFKRLRIIKDDIRRKRKRLTGEDEFIK